MLRRSLIFTLFLVTWAWGQPAEPSQQAQNLIKAGRSAEAMPLLQGNSFATRLLRAEALLEQQRFAEAEALVSSLSQESAGLPSDLRLSLLQGRLATIAGQPELSERILRDARRQATTPDEELEVLGHLMARYVRRDNLVGVKAVVEQMQSLVGQVRSPYTLARHLTQLGQYQQASGHRTEAMTSYAAARALYHSLEMPIRAGRVRLVEVTALSESGELAAAWTTAKDALATFLPNSDEAGILDSAGRLTSLSHQLPEKREETMALLTATLEELSREPVRTALEIDLIRYRYQSQGGENATRVATEEILKRPGIEPNYRRAALRLAAEMAALQGQFEEAESMLRQALEGSVPLRIEDRHRMVSPGPLLLSLAEYQRDQHRYREALLTVQQALKAQSGPDWKVWRLTAGHYHALQTVFPLYDLDLARQQMRTALDEADTLEILDHKANFLTSILAALSINRAVSMSVLDPAEFALADYDPMARALLTEMISPAGATDKYIALYDSWLAKLRAAGDFRGEANALLFKGLFLEAAERAPEARAVLLECGDLADRHQLTFMAMNARLLLARLEHLQGRYAEALPALRTGARLAAGAPPQAERFYNLLLGSYEREHGDPKLAIVAFDRAIALDQDQTWNGHYGQALSLERLERWPEAVEALNQALAQKELATRRLSYARVLGARGRLLVRMGQPEGLEDLATAFPSLLEGADPNHLRDFAIFYADSLVAADRQQEALDVGRRSLDQLLQRGLPAPSATAPLFEWVATQSLSAGLGDQALRYLELSRSADLMSTVKLSMVKPSDPATVSLLRDLEDLKGKLDGLQREAAQNEDERRRLTLSQVLASTRGEFFSKLDELKRQEPDFEALVQLSGSDLSAIQSGLTAETALIEYFPAENRLYLFVVTKDRFRLHEVSIARKDLARAVNGYMMMVRDPDSNPSKLSTASHLLFDLLMKPALASLEGQRRLLLVPSGPLWHVSFEELRDTQGQSLDESYEVGMLTSADLLRTMAKGSRPDSQGPSHRAVLLGAPDAADLPGAQAELKAIQGLLPGSRRLDGANATSAALQSAAQRSDLLHIASHRAGDCRRVRFATRRQSHGGRARAKLYHPGRRPLSARADLWAFVAARRSGGPVFLPQRSG
jgi:tetratricopeptide (TPR) repeat protein